MEGRYIHEEEDEIEPEQESLEEETPIIETVEKPVKDNSVQDVQEEVVDYREDVKEWMKENNSELFNVEEAVDGLLKAFKHSPDFYDGLRRIDARSDMGRLFLELLTRFMSKYERTDDSNYKEEVVNYIKANTKELELIQEKVNYLLKAFEYADDFIYGLERIEPSTDLSRSFIELLARFVEQGLSDE